MTVPRPDSAELADRAAEWLSAYVHLPFCRRVCPYCDFAVVADRLDEADRYVAAVVAEIERTEPAGSFDAVFFGGGTPSLLPPGAITALIGALRRRHGLSPEAEISLEANPEDWDAATGEALVAAGVTRLSLGVQSFDSDVLSYLGRVHTPEQAAAAVAGARRAGFGSVSADLIFGAPVESLASWSATVGAAIDGGVDHLSSYALTVERGTALSRAVADGAPAPDDDDQADKWELVDEAATAAGLVRYEVSNAARPGHPCRYNLGTWAQGSYLGFGLGAHGHRDGVRTRNVRRLDAYLRAVESGRSPVAGTDRLTPWGREQERLMLGLRRRAGVVSGVGGARLLAGSEGRRLVDAGILAEIDGRLMVLDPLRTDAVTRAVLDLVPGTGEGP